MVTSLLEKVWFGATFNSAQAEGDYIFTAFLVLTIALLVSDFKILCFQQRTSPNPSHASTSSASGLIVVVEFIETNTARELRGRTFCKLTT
jgi:hypothetical protein